MSRPARLELAGGLVIAMDEVELDFARSGGPGGQNVNKVESKVVLRFPLARSKALTDEQRALACERLASRLTNDGDLVLHAATHRDRARNIEEAFARLSVILDGALKRARKRKATKPTKGSQRRRLDDKRRRSSDKRGRRGGVDE